MLLISGAGRISPNAARAAGAAGFISKDWSADEVALTLTLTTYWVPAAHELPTRSANPPDTTAAYWFVPSE